MLEKWFKGIFTQNVFQSSPHDNLIFIKLQFVCYMFNNYKEYLILILYIYKLMSAIKSIQNIKTEVIISDTQATIVLFTNLLKCMFTL